MELKNKTITILGFSRSGQDAAKLADRQGAKLKISDNSSESGLKQAFAKFNFKEACAEFGKHTEEFISGSNLIILSPGIRLDSAPLAWAKKRNIPVISEIEFAYQFCRGKIVAVTGTNGKTTVTTLIGEVLKLAQKKVFVCGNIGKPFSRFVLDVNPEDVVVLEISSFQLENIKEFRPYVAVFLNFSQNHLDRHADMAEYLSAKKRIFMNQTSDDYAVLNYTDKIVRGVSEEIKSKVIFFNREEDKTISNPNYLAALAVAKIFEVNREKCLNLLNNFKGIEHRMEFVRNIKGVDFINDSKATTVDAAVWAINNIDKPIIMIAGGRDKHVDFSLIKDLVNSKVKELVLVGEAKEKIKKSLSGKVKILETDAFEQAVRLAFRNAQKGDCVLLCPMCTSFDMFRDFEERGRVFKEIVSKL